MISKKQLKYFDIWLIMIVIALVVIGIIAIGSATHINNPNVDPYYVNKQILGFTTGFLLLLIVAFIDYRFLGHFYIVAYLVNLGLLIAVLLIGKNVSGATRWLEIGPFSLQPSEFSKIILIFFLARLIDRFQKHVNHIGIVFIILLLIGVPTYLIQKQPDLSTSLVLIVILIIQLYIGKINYKYILIGFVIGILGIVGIFWAAHQPDQVLLKKVLKPHQIVRIMSFINPEEYSMEGAYQTSQSVRAIGSGQLSGKGLYKGTLNQFRYLPEPRTDFIFSVIGEEFGFIGCMVVLGLILLLLLRCIWVAKDASDLFGRLIIAGVVAMIFFQTFVHVGVTTGIIPNTGIPLPFISYGLSSLWSNMIGIGLVINVGMRRKKSYF